MQTLRCCIQGLVGFSMDDRVWNHSTPTKNRHRLLRGDISRRFFAQVIGQAERADLLSKEPRPACCTERERP